MTQTAPAVAIPPATERLPRRSGYAVAVAAALVAGCGLVGYLLTRHGDRLHLGTIYPLAGRWWVHATWWALPAIVTGILIARCSNAIAARLRWGALLVTAFATAVVWTVALSIVSGGFGQIGRPIATVPEYLHDVPRIRALGTGEFLRQFVSHVVQTPPLWTTHVSGHGPLATLSFVWLADLGLGSPGASGLVCILAGASAVPSVLSATRVLAGADVARRAAPFVAAAPLALWVGTSADAIFAGTAAAGLCAMVHAGSRERAGRRTGALLGVIGGLLLGACLFMSYGLTLFGLVVLAAAWAQRAWRPLIFAAAGVLLVYLTFRSAGFDWFAGFAATRERVMVGGAWQDRPGAYFIFADPAALAIAVGPAVIAAAASVRRGWPRGVWAVPLGVAVAIGLAIASNLAKGEVERIYLPFAVWLLPLASMIPVAIARRWLAVQVGWTLAIALVTYLTW